MGLITLLRNVLGIPKPAPAPSTSSLDSSPLPPLDSSPPLPLDASPHPPTSSRVHRTPRIEIYGPAGLRAFVRTALALTHTRCEEHYAVHELLFPGEAASAANGLVDLVHANEDSVLHTNAKDSVLHANEEAGRDIAADADGFWRDILGPEQRMDILGSEQRMGSDGGGGRVTVDAGPIVHRGACSSFCRRLVLCSLTCTVHTRRQIRASASSSANANTPPPRTTCRARSSSWATRPTRPR